MTLFDDPTFLPITIIFLGLLLIALWQKLDKYTIPLFVIYIIYAIYSMATFKNEVIQEDIHKSPSVNEVVHIAPKLEVNETHKSEIKELEQTEWKEDKFETSKEPVLPNLRVNSLLMCESIIDSIRKPVNVGTNFPVSVGKIFCYSGIRNLSGERTVLYEWYFDGKYINTIPVNINRSVHWRSWTFKSISDAHIGSWYVVIRDQETQASLDTTYFSIFPE